MGKRNTIVLSSSDDDDNELSLGSILSHSKSKSRPSSVPRRNSRRPKKARLSYSSLRSKGPNEFDEIKLFCEDFDEGFNGFKITNGSRRSNGKDQWVDKYKPRSFEELAVQKKKVKLSCLNLQLTNSYVKFPLLVFVQVEEVKTWFEDRLRKKREEFRNNVLVISGPAGVGKSATVHAIASHLGATLWEWNTPTPTVWQEHLHNSSAGIRYTSKLDEFETFVERIRKYGLIPSSFSEKSETPIVLLIDDLPVVNGKVAYERLRRCLHLLVQSALIPTVMLITDCGKADALENNPQNWEELQLSLERAGAYKVALNPITVNAIKKTLSRLCREEHCNVNAEQIDLIAKACGGDIRHAIASLQYFCVKPHPKLSLSFTNGTSTSSRERPDESDRLDDGFSLPFGKDDTLSLFHALGKFLHNKRETETLIPLDQDAFLVKERFARLPMKMDAPERVLCKAHGQARPITDFLHENVLDFLSEEAIDDACVVTSYLSDADFFLASLSGVLTRNYEAENVVQSAAASVAVRGVLFGNFHPSPSRWHVIRRPSLWGAEQSLRLNKLEMASQKFVAYDGLSLLAQSVVATEFKPVLKWLGFRNSGGIEAHHTSRKDIILDDDSFDGSSLDDRDNETTDDEIEDW